MKAQNGVNALRTWQEVGPHGEPCSTQHSRPSREPKGPQLQGQDSPGGPARKTDRPCAKLRKVLLFWANESHSVRKQWEYVHQEHTGPLKRVPTDNTQCSRGVSGPDLGSRVSARGGLQGRHHLFQLQSHKHLSALSLQLSSSKGSDRQMLHFKGLQNQNFVMIIWNIRQIYWSECLASLESLWFSYKG